MKRSADSRSHFCFFYSLFRLEESYTAIIVSVRSVSRPAHSALQHVHNASSWVKIHHTNDAPVDIDAGQFYITVVTIDLH